MPCRRHCYTECVQSQGRESAGVPFEAILWIHGFFLRLSDGLLCMLWQNGFFEHVDEGRNGTVRRGRRHTSVISVRRRHLERQVLDSCEDIGRPQSHTKNLTLCRDGRTVLKARNTFILVRSFGLWQTLMFCSFQHSGILKIG